MSHPPSGAPLDDISAILAEAGIEAAREPALAIGLRPRRLIFANAAALSRLGAADASTLEARLLAGGEPGARRLRDLAGALAPGAPARLERLRFFAGVRADIATFLVQRIDRHGGLLLLSTPGAQKAVTAREPAASAASVETARSVPATLETDKAAPTPDTSAAPDRPSEATVDSRDAAPASAGAAPPAPRLTHASAAPAARAARFVWESDAAHRFVAVGRALRETVGAPGDVEGRAIAEVIAAYGLDPEGRIVAALERRATWSALRLAWPIEDGLEAASIDLFGAPAFDRARTFVGFRGFGVIRPDRLPAPKLETSVPPQSVEPPATPDGGGAPVESEATALAAGETDDRLSQVDEATAPATQAPDAAGPPEEARRARGNDPSNAETIARGEDDAAEEPEPRKAAIVAPSAEGAANDSLPPEPPQATMDEASTPLSGAAHNVVPLRPNQPPLHAAARLAETPDATTPAPAARTPAGVELSAAERQAFRDIARSLGARPIEERRRQPASTAPPRDEPAATIEAPAVNWRSGPRDLLAVASPDNDAASADDRVTSSPPVTPLAPAAATSLATARDLLTAELARNGSTMLDRMPVGLLVARGDDPLYANRTLLELLDFETLDDLRRAGGLAQIFRRGDATKLAEGADAGAVSLVARDGQATPVDVRIQKIEWEGAPASMLTVRRALEGELGGKVKTLELELRTRQSEARELHAILDTATDGVAMLDENGAILALNRSAEALFGYDQNEVAGENFAMLFSPQSQRSAADYLDGLKSNGVASVLNDGREVIGRERQGGSIPLFMTIGRISTSSPTKFCAVLRDMTHWKKAERQLEEAKRDAERASALKSDFLAKISHEVRTPLNAILGFAEVIIDERFGPIGNARYKDYLKDIHASGAHVMSLVNDLLDLSKIEAGKLELAFGAVDANRVVSECVSLMQAQALQDRVILRVSLAPRLPQIVADERSLRQIVLNLLSNAVKFNEPGGQVIVSTALTDAGHAVIRIRDTGIGMSDDEIEIALEPFRQIATARARSGTGLGLPLTKALVEANRASFTIKSKKREGTLVEIAFPPTRVLAE